MGQGRGSLGKDLSGRGTHQDHFPISCSDTTPDAPWTYASKRLGIVPRRPTGNQEAYGEITCFLLISLGYLFTSLCASSAVFYGLAGDRVGPLVVLQEN